jgi:hypothetical protein
MKITEDQFLGEDLVHIEFDEFFQLFNQDTLDKSLVSAYDKGIDNRARQLSTSEAR